MAGSPAALTGYPQSVVTTVRETERKFDAAEDDVLPILGGMSEVDGQFGPREQVLGDRLPGRPALPVPDGKATVGDAVLAYFGEQAEEIIRCDPLVRQQTPDSVHTEIHDAERALPAAWRRLTARKSRRWLR